MTPVVLDASAIADYLVGTGAAAVRSLVEDQDVDIGVPALCDIEVMSAIVGLLKAGVFTEERASSAVRDYLDLPCTDIITTCSVECSHFGTTSLPRSPARRKVLVSPRTSCQTSCASSPPRATTPPEMARMWVDPGPPGA